MSIIISVTILNKSCKKEKMTEKKKEHYEKTEKKKEYYKENTEKKKNKLYLKCKDQKGERGQNCERNLSEEENTRKRGY